MTMTVAADYHIYFYTH